MKPTIRNTCYSIILISSIFLSFGVYAETTVRDKWIAFCLTNNDAGKATDECLDLVGVWQSRKNRTNRFKILPPEVSESLDLTLAPVSTPTPLIIGHYWRCINPKGSEFESCEPVLVACTNDQSSCVETP